MIIITGASRGVGKYLFDRFIMEGQEVYGTYNNTPIQSNTDKGTYYQVNIVDALSVERWIQLIHHNLNNIVLINCAGISYNSFAHKADLEKWSEVLNVNVVGTFNVIRHLLPIMREQNFGRIINFSSVVASFPTPGVSAYAASKSALIGLSKSLAVENASKGITVNNINLGYADIGMGVEQVPVSYQKSMKERIPSGVFCPPEDIFETVKYLIKTDYINGSSINLNGGLT
jgi:NAD(P)-dependent dehydrogenase (short-subunit alcohol dehydrogenase family)